ncbi:MAG TPA: hypothetical protein VNK03_07650 [Gammaproteobacteria bacterium]|nr:hypothetical protein [Gammaproteobacteria bacterium]
MKGKIEMMSDELFYDTKMYHQQFAKLFEPLQQYLGTNNAAYFHVNTDSSVTNIHSNYKWMENYVRGQHYNSDPHMVHPDNMSEGFAILTIEDTYKYQEYNDTVILDAAENKFNYGFSYVTKTDLDFTAWCFTTNTNNHKFINILLNQPHIIKSFIQKIENQMKLAFPELQQSKAKLIELKGDLFFRQIGIVSREQGGVNYVN